MKKTLPKIVVMIVAVMMIFTGCGSKTGNIVVKDHYEYDLSEYVKVGEYMGLDYEALDIEVTDEEFAEEIDNVLQQFSTQTELSEGTVENEDYVKLSYSLEMDGEEIEGAAAEDYTLQVGSGQLLTEIDEALVGKEVGETFTVELTFPDDYDVNPDFAGEDGIFTVTVESKYRIDYPDYNDEFVSRYLGYDTVEEYEDALLYSMYQEKYDDAKYDAGEAIWYQILETVEIIQYPEKEVQDYADRLWASFTDMCDAYGMDYDEALEGSLGIDRDEFMEEINMSAEAVIGEEMVLYYIARENDLEYTKDEILDYLNDLLDVNGWTAEEFENTYGMDIGTYAEENSIISSLLYQRVFYFLVDNGNPI